MAAPRRVQFFTSYFDKVVCNNIDVAEKLTAFDVVVSNSLTSNSGVPVIDLSNLVVGNLTANNITVNHSGNLYDLNVSNNANIPNFNLNDLVLSNLTVSNLDVTNHLNVANYAFGLVNVDNLLVSNLEVTNHANVGELNFSNLLLQNLTVEQSAKLSNIQGFGQITMDSNMYVTGNLYTSNLEVYDTATLDYQTFAQELIFDEFLGVPQGPSNTVSLGNLSVDNLTVNQQALLSNLILQYLNLDSTGINVGAPQTNQVDNEVMTMSEVVRPLGSFDPGSWTTRNLTEMTGEITGAFFSPPEFTLPAGKYYIEGSSPAFSVNSHQIRVHSSVRDIYGTSEYAPGGTQNRSFLSGTFTLDTTETFRLQHQCQTSNFAGYGISAGFGADTYSVLEVTKIK